MFATIRPPEGTVSEDCTARLLDASDIARSSSRRQCLSVPWVMRCTPVLMQLTLCFFFCLLPERK